MRHRPMPLRSASLALLVAMCAPRARAETLAPSTRLEEADRDAARDDAGESGGLKRTAEPERPCFAVSVQAWSDADDHLSGWGSVDRTARGAGLGCEVKGWAPIDACGQTISAYVADCPDGTFTFTRTEADCYQVLGCRAPREAAADRAR